MAGGLGEGLREGLAGADAAQDLADALVADEAEQDLEAAVGRGVDGVALGAVQVGRGFIRSASGWASIQCCSASADMRR